MTFVTLLHYRRGSEKLYKFKRSTVPCSITSSYSTDFIFDNRIPSQEDLFWIPDQEAVSQFLAHQPKRVYYTCRHKTPAVIPGHHPVPGIHPTSRHPGVSSSAGYSPHQPSSRGIIQCRVFTPPAVIPGYHPVPGIHPTSRHPGVSSSAGYSPHQPSSRA